MMNRKSRKPRRPQKPKTETTRPRIVVGDLGDESFTDGKRCPSGHPVGPPQDISGSAIGSYYCTTCQKDYLLP